jgi:hypothetical protein
MQGGLKVDPRTTPVPSSPAQPEGFVMAKVETTAIAAGVRGKVGNLVFRRRGRSVVTSLMPRRREIVR